MICGGLCCGKTTYAEALRGERGGVILSIDNDGGSMVIRFDERTAVYRFELLDQIELAYAVTVHKSQGSEYPAVVLPLLTGPKMLFYRNLLCTAVTRAKKCVTIIGSRQKVLDMIANTGEQTRYSGLKDVIQDYAESSLNSVR